jgi:hypothetical protein
MSGENRRGIGPAREQMRLLLEFMGQGTLATLVLGHGEVVGETRDANRFDK